MDCVTFIKFLLKMNIKNISMTDCKESGYHAPEVEVIDISSEGVLCTSGFEDLSKEDGIW